MIARSWAGLARELSDASVSGPFRSEDRSVATLTRRDVVLVSAHAAGSRVPFDQFQAATWIRDRLRPYVQSPLNWDAHSGRPLDPAVADAAERLLVPILMQGVPAPALVPTSGGGLGLEWHHPDAELVIHLVAAPDPFAEATAFLWDGRTATEREGRLADVEHWLSDAFSRLAQTTQT